MQRKGPAESARMQRNLRPTRRETRVRCISADWARACAATAPGRRL